MTGTNGRWQSRVPHLLRQGKRRKMLIAISDFDSFSLIGVSEYERLVLPADEL